MLVIPGTFLVLVSLLLFTYYNMKANEDDLNRPSFFNSKKRKYFLLSCAILMFAGGEFLIFNEESYYWMGLFPLLYYLAYYLIKKESTKNIIITKTFNFYKAFSSPGLAFSDKEHLTAPVEFLVMYGKTPKDFRDKAHKYLEERIEEGKIKTARDLPQEAWTIIGSIGKAEIKQDPNNILPQKKIDYYYEEIIEGKEHKAFIKIFLNWLRDAEVQLERMFSNFAFVSQPRPDFTDEEVGLANVNVSREGVKKGEATEQLAVFPGVPLEIAEKFGWVSDSSEYYHLAALEFQRRFPKHKISKHIKKQHKYSDEEIFNYAQDWQKLDTSKIKLFS